MESGPKGFYRARIGWAVLGGVPCLAIARSSDEIAFHSSVFTAHTVLIVPSYFTLVRVSPAVSK